MRVAAAALLALTLGLLPPSRDGAAEPGVQAAVSPAGEVYGWRDDRGVVRYTSRLERVPGAARERTERIFRDPGTGVALVLPLRNGPLLADTGRARQGDEATAWPAGDGLPEAPKLRSEAPTLPPVASSGSADAWAIQLEATELSGWLRPLDALALLEGRRLYRTRFESHGQTWERLRLGFFPSLEAARAAVDRLQPDFPGAWVDAVDGAERSESARQAIAAPSHSRPAPQPVAGAEAAYAIQLIARPVDTRLRLLDRLELLERHRLYRRTIVSRGAVWERLRLGDFPSFEAARSVLRELQSSYPDAWIDRSEG